MELFENNRNLNLIFRNRLRIVKKEILEKRGLDAIILIFSYDSLNNSNILKFGNWLLFGYSSSIELEEKALNFAFNETFLVIQNNHIYVFSSNNTKEFFYLLFSKIDDMIIEYEFLTQKEEANSEYIQMIKIAKFLEHSYTIKKIGVPLLQKEKNNILEIEKWPLVTAYGLDILGEGFFTLKHEIVDISSDLEKIYHLIDISACNTLIYTKAYKLETALSDFFTLFDRESLDKRLNRSEMYLNENQELELLLLNYNENKKNKFSYLTDLPDPRVLVGVNTDKNFEDGSSAEPIYKIYFDYKIPSFHMTYENFDPITGIRFGRTFFLSTLQKQYLDYDDNQDVIYQDAKVYEDSKFLFDIYSRLVKFFRDNQYDIVAGKLDKKLAISNLRKEINDFIEKEYNKNEKNFDYFVKEHNILINTNSYIILGTASKEFEKEKRVTQTQSHSSFSKVTILRIEVKEIASVISNRRIGSLLFCDSFLQCNSDINSFNLTQDIIPFKFIYTSHIHLTGKENSSYDIPQILRSISPCRFQDIEIKGLAFHKNFYNIPYLFTDSSDLGYDPNQMCLTLTGKLLIYENYIVIHDNSLGYFVIESQNLEMISYKDEINFSSLLLNVKDSSKLPLSGIIKNEILIYIPCKSERTKSIKFDFMTYLKNKYSYRFREMRLQLEEEYELAIKGIRDNEHENLSYISNSFNLTNIFDVIGDMYEYEYIELIKGGILQSVPRSVEKYKFEQYQSIKSELLKPEFCEKLNFDKINLIFLFGTTLDEIDKYCLSVQDLGKSLGIKSEIIIPSIDLINDYTNFYGFYFKELTSANNVVGNKKKVFILGVQHEIKIVVFLNHFILNFDEHNNFLEKFNVLNICYTLNYNSFIKNKHKDLFSHLYNIVFEDLINFILIDEGYLSSEKIEKTNKIINYMNPKAIIFNTRSFSLNTKEVKKIFENNSCDFIKILKFYNENYFSNIFINTQNEKKVLSSTIQTEEMFFNLKFRVKKELIEEFINKFLNRALKYCRENQDKQYEKIIEKETTKNEYNEYMNMSDQDFQNELAEMVKEVKRNSKEPVIEKIIGYIKYIRTDKIHNEEIYKLTACHKEKKLKKIDNNFKISTEHIGLLISGKNIIENYKYIQEILSTLSGEIPEFKPYRKKEDLSEEEIFNLNLVNFFREIPEGWWWDGPVILDDNGNRYGQHPYLDTFIEEYLIICNLAVDEYNKKVSDEISKYFLI